MEPISDSLRERLRLGEKSALDELLKQLRAPLLAFISSRLGPAMKSRVEAEDILQDMSVVALKRLSDLAIPTKEPYPWLCHLSEQRIIDTHRRLFGAQKRSAERQVPLNTPLAGSTGGTLEDLLAASMTSASEALSRNLKEVRLLAAIEQLPAKHRTVLQLRFSQGLTTGEIAEQVGSTDAAIRVQLSRLLAKLQQLLGES